MPLVVLALGLTVASLCRSAIAQPIAEPESAPVAVVGGMADATVDQPLADQPLANEVDTSAVRDAEMAPSHGRRQNFFELGLTTSVVNDPREQLDADAGVESSIALSVSGALYFGRFFIESLGAGAGPLKPDGLNIGLTLSDRTGLSTDLLLVSSSGIVGDTESVDPGSAATEAERDAHLLERGTLEIGTGLRITRYAGDWINQLRIVRTFAVEEGDTAGTHGIDGTLRIGRQWPLQKWLLRGIASLRYVSVETNRAIWGIGPDEATSRLPRYVAGAGLDADLEIGAVRPLSRNWVFHSVLRVRGLSDAVRDSPLVDDDFQAEFATGIHYVF